MSIMATGMGGEGRFPNVEVGVHKARCVKVIDLGTQHNEYQGDVSWKRQVLLIWEVPTETNGNGEPLTISKFYTLSLHEKSNLGNDLGSWRGRPFTDKERQGFDISALCGQPCMLNVMEGKNGKPRVAAVLPAPKDSPVAPQFNDSVVFSITDWQENKREAFNLLSEGIRNIILKSKELEEDVNSSDQTPASDDIDLGDVPF
tara:strand:- start:11239 stop:11844 length:606 start_codon:yes stop_codon:yes gene_type:complete